MQYSKILAIVFVCIFFANSAFAQQNTNLNGLVVDQSGNSILEVLIKISPISKGLVSDAQGKFSINLPSGKTYTLEFSFMGFEGYSEKITLGSTNQTLKIKLDDDTNDLE